LNTINPRQKINRRLARAPNFGEIAAPAKIFPNNINCPTKPSIFTPTRPSEEAGYVRDSSNMADKDSFLHLARPLGPAPIAVQQSTAPLSVTIQPQVHQPNQSSSYLYG
jgi:hypothetical protein